MADAHGVNEPRGPDAWFQSLPVVTKYWFGSSLVCTLAVNFNIISPYLIVFAWENVKSKLELWRLLSCFLYVGPVRSLRACRPSCPCASDLKSSFCFLMFLVTSLTLAL